MQSLTVFLVEQDTERQGKWVMSTSLQIVVELLNARRVAYGRVAIGSARWALGGIDTVLSVYVIQMLRFRIVWLEVLIAERPRG